MNLRVIGCHGRYPAVGGCAIGYLLEHGGKSLLLDCGSGVFGALLKLCDPASLEAVLLSHLHFDHASDLLVLRYYLEYVNKTLPLYIPKEDASVFRSLLVSPAFDIRPYSETLEIMGLQITHLPVVHPVPTYALRLSDGQKALVYTGDTNDCPALPDFSRNADVLLADAAFLNSEWDEKKPHMSAFGAASLAAQAGAKRLYLTHLPADHAPETLEREAQALFPNAQAARPGMVIAL